MPEVQSPDRQPAPVGTGRSIRFYLFGVVAVVAACAAVGCFHFSRNNDVTVAREARASVVDRGPRVEVVTATQGPDRRTITLLADVRSNQDATLYAKVSGYVQTVTVSDNQHVAADSVLVQVDPAEYAVRLAQAQADLAAKGEKIYAANCVACHQATGKGVPGAFPALDGSKIVTGAKAEQIALVLNGKAGTAMVAWKQLSDADLAAVITYTRNSWGNKTGEAVQPAEIKAARL